MYEIVIIDFYDFALFQTYSKSINSIFLLLIIINKIISNLKKEVVHKNIKTQLFLIFFLTLGTILNLPTNLLINYKSITVYVIYLINIINYIMLYVVLINYLRKFNTV